MGTFPPQCAPNEDFYTDYAFSHYSACKSCEKKGKSLLTLPLRSNSVVDLVVDLSSVGTTTLSRTHRIDELCGSRNCHSSNEDDCDWVLVPIRLQLILPHDYLLCSSLIKMHVNLAKKKRAFVGSLLVPLLSYCFNCDSTDGVQDDVRTHHDPNLLDTTLDDIANDLGLTFEPDIRLVSLECFRLLLLHNIHLNFAIEHDYSFRNIVPL